MKTPEPGIYEHVSFADYCEWDCVNNSSLGPALRSGKHYRHALDNPREDTNAFRFGRLAHEGRLEPALVLDRYAVMPDLTEGILVDGKPAKKAKATAEYRDRVKKWEDENTGKQFVPQESFDEVKGVLNALWENDNANQWFAGSGMSEVSIIWDDDRTGLRCKARIDKVVSDTLLADMKTTRDASRFESFIVDHGYDRQAAFYLDGWRAVTGHVAQFAFAAVESTAPFGCRAAVAGPSIICRGRSQYREALAVVLATREQRVQGYEQPEAFELAGWARREPLTLYCGGEPIEVR